MQRYGTSRGDLRELSQLLVQSRCQRTSSISRRFPDVSASRCLHKSCDVCTTRMRCAQVVHFFANACDSGDVRAHKWPPDLSPHTRECAPRRCAVRKSYTPAQRPVPQRCAQVVHPHKRPVGGSHGDRPRSRERFALLRPCWSLRRPCRLGPLNSEHKQPKAGSPLRAARFR